MEAVHQYVHNLIAMRRSTKVGAVIFDVHRKESLKEALQDFSPTYLHYSPLNTSDFLTKFVESIQQKQQLVVIDIDGLLDSKLVHILEQLAVGQATVIHPSSGEIYSLHSENSTILLVLEQSTYDQLPSEFLPYTHSS